MFEHPFQKPVATLLPVSASSTSNTSAYTDNHTDSHTDDHIDPLQPLTTATRRTKPPPLPITVPNWNDPPTSWTPTPTPRSVPGSRCTSAASTTAFDINALYATASPRKLPRRRQSSVVREREAQSAASTPGIHPHSQFVPGQTGFYDAGYTNGEWENGKVERGRGSISESLGGDYDHEDEDHAEYVRKRTRGRKAVKISVVVLLVVCLGVLGVWVRGGPFTGLGLSERVNGFGYGDSTVADGSSLSGSGWGFNVSGGVSVAEFGERCLAWGGEWREKGRGILPGWVGRYFSGAWLSSGEADVDVVHVDTMTQTVRLREGSGWELPKTMSRVTRGRVFTTTKEGEVKSIGTGEQMQTETVLRSPKSVGADGGEGMRVMIGGQEVLLRNNRDGNGNGEREKQGDNGVVGKVVLNEEAESRMARAARASEMWIHHAPVRPIHDVGHEGREEGKSSRGEL